MLRSLLAGAALLPALLATAAHAQTDTDRRAVTDNLARSAPLDRSVSALQGIELRTVQDSSSAAIRFGNVISAGEDYSSISFGISAPISKGSDTRLATFDGLTNATALEFRYAHATLDGLREPDPARDLEICNTAQHNAGHEVTAKDACDRQYIQDHYAAGLSDYHRVLDPNRRLWLYGANARYGVQSFDWFDQTTLDKNTQEENPWSVSIYGGLAFPEQRSLLLLSLTAQDAFKDARSGVMCPAGPGPVTCVSGPLGAPTETEGLIGAVESRRVIGDRAGFALTVSYDAETEDYGIDLPVYLVPDGSDALTGGVRLGWTSDEHEVTAGIFVSKAFSFLDLTPRRN